MLFGPDEPMMLPVLPSLRIVNGLIQRFFKLCFILAPFIDERIFMNEIGQIFKNKETIGYDDLYYRSSTISILLIMLRFAYLTIPFKKNQNNHLSGPDSDFLRLIENTNANISSSYVEYAQHLILRPRGYQKIPFRKIQAVLFLKVYRLHCPEDEDKTSQLLGKWLGFMVCIKILVSYLKYLKLSQNKLDCFQKIINCIKCMNKNSIVLLSALYVTSLIWMLYSC